jgi:hypothetical protein
MHPGKVIWVLFLVAFLGSCQPEPFDPATAQQQMTGKWAYSEGDGENACQMQISADGSDGIKITNFACSRQTVKATILDENSLNIQKQTVGGDTFEGSGSIKKYRTVTLQFTYDNGREKVSIVANCTKI